MRYSVIFTLFFLAAGCGAGRTISNNSNDSGVSNDASAVETCNNGAIDTGETCDGTNFGAVTCETLGFVGGGLACTDACQLDTSGCVGQQCGNGELEGEEVCDTTTNGETCASRGFVGGSLSCLSDCSGYDTSGCWNVQPVCGNGELEPGEMCDDGNHVLTDWCPDGPGGTCQLAACGDGFVEAGVEECDDGNHSTADDCPDGPTGSCAWATCGDGFVHGMDEVCDPLTDPACYSDCSGYCGDGVLDSRYEMCDDGNNLDGDSCYSDCSGYCGDDIVHDGVTFDQNYQQVFPDHGEECDGGPLCTPDCTISICGDGICWGTEVNTCNTDCDCVAIGGIVCNAGCCYSQHPQHVVQCCTTGCTVWNGTFGTQNCGTCGNNCGPGQTCVLGSCGS